LKSILSHRIRLALSIHLLIRKGILESRKPNWLAWWGSLYLKSALGYRLVGSSVGWFLIAALRRWWELSAMRRNNQQEKSPERKPIKGKTAKSYMQYRTKNSKTKYDTPNNTQNVSCCYIFFGYNILLVSYFCWELMFIRFTFTLFFAQHDSSDITSKINFKSSIYFIHTVWN
jgi:hypothetical protein